MFLSHELIAQNKRCIVELLFSRRLPRTSKGVNLLVSLVGFNPSRQQYQETFPGAACWSHGSTK
jgi:hypothetical protein